MNCRMRIGIALGVVLASTARMTLGLPHVVQEHYRWRNDDGTEQTAEWKQAADTPHTGQLTNENIRLRFTISNGTGLEAAPDVELRLQYQTNRFETFIDVPASAGSSPFVMSATPHYDNSTATSNRLTGTGDYQPGVCVEASANKTPPIDIEGEHYINVEYCFKALANVQGGVTYYFQLSDDGVELDEYSEYAQMTFTIRPTLNNSAGEANLTAASALLRGMVTDTGGEAPNVYVCWGTTDGGTTPANWDTVINLGARSGAFSTPVSGLVAGQTYYYRCYAVNSAGTAWAPARGAFSTPGPGVGHARASYIVSEDDGSFSVTVRISNQSASPSTVDIATVDGTATAGSDYSATNRTLTWATGDTAPKTFDVFVTNDAGDDDGESFYVVLSNPSGCTISGSATTTVALVDMDGVPTAQFALSASAGSESVTQTNIMIILSHAYGASVDVSYARTGGDADDPGDYSAGSGTVTFPASVTTSNIIISVTNDTQWEQNETFTLTLTGVSGGSTVGPGASHTYTIVNDDVGAPVVRNWLGAAEVTESSATLRGQVIDTLGEAPHVFICWGPATAGTDRAAWSHEIDMGVMGVGTFSTNIAAGLTEGVTYYYRCVATNSVTNGWADGAEPFTPATPPSDNLLVNPSVEAPGRFSVQAENWFHSSDPKRTNAVPRSGSYSIAFAKVPAPSGQYVYGQEDNKFKVSWNGQYADGGYHPAGGIRPGFVLSGAAYTRARLAGNDNATFAFGLRNLSDQSNWMSNSLAHNNVEYQRIAASNSAPMSVSSANINFAPVLARTDFVGSGEQLYHGDDISLYATLPKLELLPAPTAPVAFPATPFGMTSELTLNARCLAGTANTVLYGAYTTNASDMTRSDWNYKAWEEVHDPADVFSIISGGTLVATNNSGWHPMTVQFSPAGPGSYTGIVRIATTDPNDWYGGGGKLLNSIVYEQYVLTATSSPSLTISVNDTVAVEKDSGTTAAIFTITLSSIAPEDVSVSYSTETTPGSAVSGSDYVRKTGTATVVAGKMSTTVTVTVNSDDDNEGNEVFYLDLSDPQPSGQGIVFSDGRGMCTIVDDDNGLHPRGTTFRMK